MEKLVNKKETNGLIILLASMNVFPILGSGLAAYAINKLPSLATLAAPEWVIVLASAILVSATGAYLLTFKNGWLIYQIIPKRNRAIQTLLLVAAWALFASLFADSYLHPMMHFDWLWLTVYCVTGLSLIIYRTIDGIVAAGAVASTTISAQRD